MQMDKEHSHWAFGNGWVIGLLSDPKQPREACDEEVDWKKSSNVSCWG